MKNRMLLLLALLLALPLTGCPARAPASSADPPSAAPSEGPALYDLTGQAFDLSLSYANWAEGPAASFGAQNGDRLAWDDARHLPIYKLDTKADLEQFLLFDDKFTFDCGYDEVPSFLTVVAPYDEAFFEENTLLLVYISAGSGSYRFGTDRVLCDGTTLCVHAVPLNDPEVVTCDMAGWFLTLALPDAAVARCTQLDAVLDPRP